ncbi:MAG: hypothetical protein AAF715_13740 [Myxococcota bacterium]
MATARRSIIAAVLALGATGCPGDPEPSGREAGAGGVPGTDEGNGGAGAIGGGDTVPRPSPDPGRVAFEDCRNVDTYTDDQGSVIDCSYALTFAPSLVGERRASPDLLIHFAGGGMKCAMSDLGPNEPQGRYVEPFVNDGYVVAVACLAERKELNPTSDHMAFHQEAARVAFLVDEIVRAVTPIWSGEHLLLSGASHGGAALTIAFARTDIDASPAMSGRTTTGVCAIDAPLDAYQRELDYQSDRTDCDTNRGTRRQNICNRYRVATAATTPALRCDATRPFGTSLPQCHPLTAVPFDPSCEAALQDSLVFGETISGGQIRWSPADLTHDHFKLISCGDDVDVCRDGRPHDGPTRAMMAPVCERIAEAPGKTCSLSHFPSTDHATCSSAAVSRGACKSWFEDLRDRSTR